MIWWRNLAALGVVSKLPVAFPSPKLNRSFRVYHISCYWMNIQVDPTISNLASAMLNSKIRPRAVMGYGVKIFHPSPPNYVTRSPGNLMCLPTNLVTDDYMDFRHQLTSLLVLSMPAGSRWGGWLRTSYEKHKPSTSVKPLLLLLLLWFMTLEILNIWETVFMS